MIKGDLTKLILSSQFFFVMDNKSLFFMNFKKLIVVDIYTLAKIYVTIL